jgi:hypothetical protein
MRETISATIIAQSLPALMMSYFISGITIVSSNESGNVDTRIIRVTSFVSSDITGYLRGLIDRLEREILFDLSFGFQELYFVEIDCELFGDTNVTVGHGSRQLYPYCFPTFTSGVSSYMSTNNPTHLRTFSEEINILLENLDLPQNNPYDQAGQYANPQLEGLYEPTYNPYGPDTLDPNWEDRRY